MAAWQQAKNIFSRAGNKNGQSKSMREGKGEGGGRREEKSNDNSILKLST